MFEQLLDVLPALRVALAGEVRVGELIDERELRATTDDALHVELLKARAAVGDASGRDEFELAELGGGLRPPMALPVGDNGVDPGAPLRAGVAGIAYVLPVPGAMPRYVRSSPRVVVGSMARRCVGSSASLASVGSASEP